MNGTPEFNIIKWYVAYKARIDLNRTTKDILDDLCVVAKVPPVPGQRQGFLLTGNVIDNTIAKIMRSDTSSVMEYIQRDTGLSEDLLYEKSSPVKLKIDRISEAEDLQRRVAEGAACMPTKPDVVKIDDIDCVKSQSILSEVVKIKEPFTLAKEITRNGNSKAVTIDA